ncbi:hypothetical protein [Fulvivirga sedimenti]|uniref:Uncharacterized protein n=1 Tax=Fulvivirga sedimenti TaxID=2879465 RepID=A0A9X1HL99_9BACT|nr:hypothetical protein [Fulvivirga sedimenti]MCA6073986.1 hypothetical protein [Fulvivirga sedimenti]
MIIPMILMQLGIFMDYWGDFTSNAWSVHIHYWTGTVWYIFLIFQPYYATHGQLEKHRTYGIIGMFMAGAVCFTALSMMYRDLESAHRAAEMVERFGPFKPYFFYGIAAIELVMMTAFGYAVIQSIIHRKSLEDHAWWLVSTVFIIMMPALGRGVQNIWIMMYVDNWPDIDILTPLYIAQVIIIILILVTAKYFGKLRHPATYLALAINFLNCFAAPIGKSEAVQNFLETFIKG